MMYFILLTSTWAVAATHYESAPFVLTVFVPGLLTIGCAVRVVFWWKQSARDITALEAYSDLKRTNLFAAGLAVAFTSWALTLYPFGDAYLRSHLAFYMAITVIACVFCLMHLRSAAIIVAAIVNGTFIVFFALTGQPSYTAIAINTVLVSGGMLVILMVNYKTFEGMVLANQRSSALDSETLRLATHDGVTNLPNRAAFFAHLSDTLHDAQARQTRMAVAVIDLDGFKAVNDLYGHASGDALLAEVAGRLACQKSRADLYLARTGGNSFAAVIDDARSDTELMAICDEVCALLRNPFVLPEATIVISASVGLAVFPDAATTSEQLFDRADYALYVGKRTRRGGTTLFSAALDAKINRDAMVEQSLKQADLVSEMHVVFQPIIDTRTNELAGFEALARWESSKLGKVPPGEFFQIAERAGIVSRLTRPLLKKALAAGCTWPKHVRLSFNLSAQDLNSAESVLAIVALVEASGFEARRLDFEITETAFAHDFGQVQRSIELLRHLGCGMSLDDFGTGYSSLARLHALPLTKIKIDRQFVTDIHLRPSSYKIVKSLIALSRDMGLDCVIEGVETQEELATIRQMGGSLVQGYFYSVPVSAEDAREFLKSGRFGPEQFPIAPVALVEIADDGVDDEGRLKLPAGAMEFIRQFDPDTLGPVLEGLTACDMATAIFSPEDRLMFASPVFRELYDVQSGTQTFSSIIRHCFETRRGPAIATTDINEWLRIANAKRRTERHRKFEVDLVDGRWLWALETTYGDGWILLAFMDLTSFKMKEIDLRIARDAAVLVAETDHLTGVASRRNIMRYLDESVPLARKGGELTIAILDIDHFKQINDSLGHDVGDRLLQRFGQCGMRAFRNTDRLGRVGGEEFLIVMPHTDLQAGRKALERFRKQWRRSNEAHPAETSCTFSAGICQWRPGLNGSDLYRLADQALYNAKTTGRNRIINADSLPDRTSLETGFSSRRRMSA